MNTLVFQIGVATRLAKTKKQKEKEKRRNIKKKPHKSSDKKQSFTKIVFKLKKESDTFLIKPASSKWILPSKLDISDSIRYKFNKIKQELNTSNYYLYSLKQINEIILKNSRNTMNKCFSLLEYWKPPQIVASHLQSINQLELNEWKKVKYIYIKLLKLYTLLKTLVYKYRLNKCLNNVKNTTDIVTMDPPKKPVYIIDFKQMCSYIYEASSMRKIIEQRIYVSDQMFPDPQIPVNPLSNQEFTVGQLISIISQCFAYGEYSWILDRLKTSGYQYSIFINRFQQQLKLEAIDTYFRCQPNYVKDTVIDFFDSEGFNVLSGSDVNAFTELYNSRPNSQLIKDWVKLTKRYYISTELNDMPDLLRIKLESKILVQKALQIL